MSTKKRRFFSGNTVEQALVQAASYYKISPDEIAYREVEKRHGFVRTRRRVVIQVDPENLQAPPAEVVSPSPAAAAKPGSKPSAPPSPFLDSAEDEASPPARQEEPSRGDDPAASRERYAAAEDELADDDPAFDDEPEDEPMELMAGAREAAERILELAGLDLSVTVEQGSDRLIVDLSGPDRDRLMEEDAEVLLAIEQLLPRVMRGLVGDAPPCQVDSQNFRQEREEALRGLARSAVELLRNGARAVELDTMAPGERRLVHLAVADEEDVRTDSEGEGFYKRVVIRRLDD